MPPSLALLVWLVLLLGLLLFDPAKESKTTLALWVPIIWMFIAASRLPSQWLGGVYGAVSSTIEDGNPLDRAIFVLLILLELAILMSRSFNWASFAARNAALTALILFGLISVFWSDFPFVAFKRWFRDLGYYLSILVVLSDPRPLEAIRVVLRRLGYLLIPLSVLFIKYFPQMGKRNEIWTGANMYIGATTSKNMLGVLCLVCGIYFFWDMVTHWSERRERKAKRIIALNLAFLGMTLWVLHLSNSATSEVCLVLGCLVIGAAHTRRIKRHPVQLKVCIPAVYFLYLILAFGFNMNGSLAETVGRSGNLTGRTELWRILLNMHTNPLLGTGYESFWLGPRLDWVYEKFTYVNEAHNGYLEVYLNLGLIGLFLVCAFLVASYRTICRRLKPFSNFASLSLALWTVLLFYNVTEAAFKVSHLMCVMFLFGAIVVPEQASAKAHHVRAIEDVGTEQVLCETSSVLRSTLLSKRAGTSNYRG